MWIKIINTYKKEGIPGLVKRLEIRVKRIFPNRAKCFKRSKQFFKGKGIEFGGQSTTFTDQGFWPVYGLVEDLDNCNFGNSTIWEGDIQQGKTFRYHPKRPCGRQYISNATDMSMIQSGSYDFILSCHMLEHSANPILVLSEWIRLLRDEGTLLIILPHKQATFDHLRPVTSLDHLIHDFEENTTEDDVTHLPEILKLHDLSMDPFLIDVDPEMRFKEFKFRSERNFENRILHQHVFDTKTAISLINYMKLQIIEVETVRINSILILAKKTIEEKIDNSKFTSDDAAYKNLSIFASDRK